MGLVGNHSNMTMPFYVATPIFEGAFLMNNGDKTKEQLINELAVSETERKQTERRLARLRLILRAIGDVNQLITKEKD